MKNDSENIKTQIEGLDSISESTQAPEQKLEKILAIVAPDALRQLNFYRQQVEQLLQNKIDIETENSALKNANAVNLVKIEKLKKELSQIQEYIRTIDDCKRTGNITPAFDYVYDLSDFDESAGSNDVDIFFNNLFFIANMKGKNDEYIIKNGMAVVPIYIIFTQDTTIKSKWLFKGDLKSFCEYWNKNLAEKMEDPERREALRCNYNTIKAAINKAPWKGSNIVSWRSLSQYSSKHKSVMGNAVNIRDRIIKKYS